MRNITSPDNKIFKLARDLDKKKYRDKSGLFLIEGENLLGEAVKCGAGIETILIREGYNKELYGLEDKVFMMSDRLFSKLCQTENSQGVLAIVRKPEVTAERFLKPSDGNFLILDRLQDPGNIGTILRTADSAGYELVIALKGTADIYSPKVVRAATGSSFRMPVLNLESVDELTEFTRKAGKKLVATTFDTNHYYYEEDLTKSVAIIIGNEGNGISKELIESSEIKVKIPMQGTIESLNAAVAAALLMYESVRHDQ